MRADEGLVAGVLLADVFTVDCFAGPGFRCGGLDCTVLDSANFPAAAFDAPIEALFEATRWETARLAGTGLAGGRLAIGAFAARGVTAFFFTGFFIVYLASSGDRRLHGISVRTTLRSAYAAAFDARRELECFLPRRSRRVRRKVNKVWESGWMKSGIWDDIGCSISRMDVRMDRA